MVKNLYSPVPGDFNKQQYPNINTNFNKKNNSDSANFFNVVWKMKTEWEFNFSTNIKHDPSYRSAKIVIFEYTNQDNFSNKKSQCSDPIPFLANLS